MDANQTRTMVDAVVAHDGPAFFRINRNDLPVITPENEKFGIGRIYTIRDRELLVYACGGMVSIALDAAKLLDQDGISLKVLNVSTQTSG